MSDNMIVKLQDLHHSYQIAGQTLDILKGVNFELPYDRWCCILGASGSGKTTLLNLIGGLEKCSKGSIIVNGQELSRLSRKASATFRAGSVGFIFQSYCLLPELSIAENVALAASFNRASSREAALKAEHLLETVGLADRRNHRPMELSGGEQQRAAIARALINDPPLLLADEPTGNLDENTGSGIMDLFCRIREEHKGTQSIIMITHNRDLCKFADVTAELSNGTLHIQ